MRTLLFLGLVFVGLVIVGAILGAAVGAAMPEAAPAEFGLVGHIMAMAFWGAIGLPVTAGMFFVVVVLPVWIFIALGRKFGFGPVLGAILMFTPLFPVGLFLLFYTGKEQ